MRRARSKFLSIALTMALLGAMAAVTGCAGGDMATVTVSIGNITAKAEKPSIVDRILAFLTFSTRLQADPPSVFFNRIDLTVSGAGMETIERIIPTDTGEITLDVPSGPKRVFTIVGYDDGDSRIMGGITSKDLAPGASETIFITMGNLIQMPDEPGGYTGGLNPFNFTWNFPTANYGELIGFKVYRSQDTSPSVPSVYQVILDHRLKSVA